MLKLWDAVMDRIFGIIEDALYSWSKFRRKLPIYIGLTIVMIVVFATAMLVMYVMINPEEFINLLRGTGRSTSYP